MKHIAFLSFGKDSMAQVILLKKHGYPLDEVVYVDIRFNNEISGEHPKTAAWIPHAEEILKNKFNITVKHLTADTTFYDYFYKTKKKGPHEGERWGFPFTVGAWCNSRLKLDVISKYINSLKDDVTQYIGIARDEWSRMERLKAKETPRVKYRSILFELRVRELDAMDICREFDLVSPKYDDGAFRGGCWFCVKQSLADIYQLWRDYPAYFEKLLEMEKDSRCTFNRHYNLPTLKAKFEGGFIPKRREKNAIQKNVR